MCPGLHSVLLKLQSAGHVCGVYHALSCHGVPLFEQAYGRRARASFWSVPCVAGLEVAVVAARLILILGYAAYWCVPLVVVGRSWPRVCVSVRPCLGPVLGLRGDRRLGGWPHRWLPVMVSGSPRRCTSGHLRRTLWRGGGWH